MTIVCPIGKQYQADDFKTGTGEFSAILEEFCSTRSPIWPVPVYSSEGVNIVCPTTYVNGSVYRLVPALSEAIDIGLDLEARFTIKQPTVAPTNEWPQNWCFGIGFGGSTSDGISANSTIGRFGIEIRPYYTYSAPKRMRINIKYIASTIVYTENYDSELSIILSKTNSDPITGDSDLIVYLNGVSIFSGNVNMLTPQLRYPAIFLFNGDNSKEQSYFVKDLVFIGYGGTQECTGGSFTADIIRGSKSLIVNFQCTSGSSGPWLWNFGDGVTSTKENPTHIYNTVGKFTVSLLDGIVTTTTKTDYIEVLSKIEGDILFSLLSEYTSDADISIDGNDIKQETYIQSMINIALFTDKKEENSNNNGWFMNPNIGSKLHLLQHVILKESLLPTAKEYVEEALQVLLLNKLVNSITTEVSITKDKLLYIKITFLNIANNLETFEYYYDTINRLTTRGA